MKIKQLTLYSNQLQVQKQFYTQTLGFELIEEMEVFFEIMVGTTKLRFEYREKVTAYHFAFNIPHNQVQKAKAWLEKRRAILPLGEEEIVDFSDWNAEAMYFHDANQNIVELIARRDLPNQSQVPFSTASITEVSEIGIATSDVQQIYTTIRASARVEQYDGNLERFCALGDEQGLFIIINKQTKKWIPTMVEAFSSPFSIQLLDDENNEVAFYYKEDAIQCFL